MMSKAYFMEPSGEHFKRPHPSKDFRNNKKFKKDVKRDQKKGTCFHCKKSGHFKRECRKYKREKNEANNVEEHFVVVITEVNIVGNDKDRWVNTGTIKHITNDCSCFKTNKEVEDRHSLYMGSSSTTKIVCKRNLELWLTSEKILSLTDVLHVYEIRTKS